LNDSFEELRLENYLSIDTQEEPKSIVASYFKKRKADDSEILEPLLSISPNKKQFIQENSITNHNFYCEYNLKNENLHSQNITKSTRQDSGILNEYNYNRRKISK